MLRGAAGEENARERHQPIVLFDVGPDPSPGNGVDAETTKTEGVVQFMRCRTKSCGIEDRLAPCGASSPCGIEDRVGDLEWAGADGAAVWSRSAHGLWRCWPHDLAL